MRQAQRVCAGGTSKVCLWTAMVREDLVCGYGMRGGLLPRHRRQLAVLGPPAGAVELLGLELAGWAS
jgi:hypothetical protein